MTSPQLLVAAAAGAAVALSQTKEPVVKLAHIVFKGLYEMFRLRNSVFDHFTKSRWWKEETRRMGPVRRRSVVARARARVKS